MGDSVVSALRGVQTLRLKFLQTVREAPKPFLDHMMIEKSDSDQETHLFGGTAPKVRAWVDERRPGGLHAVKFDVVNERFENSLSVDVPSLERDKISFHQRKIAELGIRMVNFPLTLLSNIRLAGATDLCWDGAPFFHNAHEWLDSGTQSNKLAATGVTSANVATDYYECVEARVKWKDDRGEVDDAVYYRLKPVLVHGPAMLQTMIETFDTEKLPTGGNNPLYKKAELRLDPRITGTGWIFEDLGQEVRPYGLQEEIPMRLTNTDVNDEKGFMRGEIAFGTEWRGTAFYGEPSLAILVGDLT